MRDVSGSVWVKPTACQDEGSWAIYLIPAPVGLLVALMNSQWKMGLSGRLRASALGSLQSQTAPHMAAGL